MECTASTLIWPSDRDWKINKFKWDRDFEAPLINAGDFVSRDNVIY